MICLVLNYDYKTGIADALPVQYVDFVDKDPGPFRYQVYSNPNVARLTAGISYSFFPKDQTIGRTFTRGELDYEFFKNNRRN